MDPTAWLPTGLLILVNVGTVAYFAGNVNAKLSAVQRSVDKLQSTESKIAVLENRADVSEDDIREWKQTGENHARQILALAKGDRLPPDAPLGSVRRRGAR